jgi:hypothetical protein
MDSGKDTGTGEAGFEDAKSLWTNQSLEYRNLVNIHPIVRGGDVRKELLRIIHDEKIDLVDVMAAATSSAFSWGPQRSTS